MSAEPNHVTTQPSQPDAQTALRAEAAEIAAEALILAEAEPVDAGNTWPRVVALIAAGQDLAALGAAMGVLARRSEARNEVDADGR